MSTVEELEDNIIALEERISTLEERMERYSPPAKRAPVRNHGPRFDREYKRVGEWIKARCTRNPDAFVPWAELYDDYAHYCREQGLKDGVFMTHQSRALTDIIRAYGAVPYRTAKYRGYQGLELTPVE